MRLPLLAAVSAGAANMLRTRSAREAIAGLQYLIGINSGEDSITGLAGIRRHYSHLSVQGSGFVAAEYVDAHQAGPIIHPWLAIAAALKGIRIRKDKGTQCSRA